MFFAGFVNGGPRMLEFGLADLEPIYKCGYNPLLSPLSTLRNYNWAISARIVGLLSPMNLQVGGQGLKNPKPLVLGIYGFAARLARHWDLEECGLTGGINKVPGFRV